MGLEVYYPDDIRNALSAAEQAASSAVDAATLQDELSQNYWMSGYRAALTTIAIAFGLVRPQGEAVSTALSVPKPE